MEKSSSTLNTATGNNKRIAKNAFFLYGRMLFSMVVSLYTSRIVLNVLGVVDFGIYNVVGGVVIVFSFLNSAMAASTQRFIAFELGKEKQFQLQKIFSTSINIHLIIAIIVVLLSLTVGGWFLNTQMNIPHERMEAANWVFYFSIISSVFTILSVPFNATIIAHEEMNVFALISILETILKLLIVFMLNWFIFDKLKLYAILTAIVTVVIWCIYLIYCKRKYLECRYTWYWDKQLIKDMGSFANWNLLGVSAGIAYNQGVNILLNIFFGTTVNAARGIAFQLQGAVSRFATNFQMAINPPITKSYARDDRVYMYHLVFKGTKFIYYLLFILSFPLMLETEYILTLWLKNVPQYASLFSKLILIDILIGSLSGSIQAVVQASGKIKIYQMVISSLLLLNLPFSYTLLKMGLGADYTFYVSIFLSVLALIGRLFIITRTETFPTSDFLKKVISPVLVVSLFSVLLSWFVTSYFVKRHILNIAVTVIIIVFIIFFLGLNLKERNLFISVVKKILHR